MTDGPGAPAPHACCTPARPGLEGADAAGGLAQRAPDPRAGLGRLVPIRGGAFTMGNDVDEGFAADGEGPSRRVVVGDFAIGEATVTNRAFAEFVRATGYVTTAEELGSSFVFYLQVPEERRARMRRTAPGLPWWLDVEGACWQRPEGPGSQVHDRPQHPVVHVSWLDAQAFCAWAGCHLPTEAQWEYAARAGLEARRYPWGDELEPEGKPRCHIWQGDFPRSTRGGWEPGAIPAKSFAPNGYGLYDMCGNVWEWCADAFSPSYHLSTSGVDPLCDEDTGRRSLRGGSFLCHDSYCNRYRVAARSSNTPTTSASNIGMRVAAAGRG